MAAKARDWLEAGARVVLVVDPRTSTVEAYRSERRELYAEGLVDLTDVLPGFRLDIAELFS